MATPIATVKALTLAAICSACCGMAADAANGKTKTPNEIKNDIFLLTVI